MWPETEPTCCLLAMLVCSRAQCSCEKERLAAFTSDAEALLEACSAWELWSPWLENKVVIYDLQGCHYHSRDLGGHWKRSAGEMQPIKKCSFLLANSIPLPGKGLLQWQLGWAGFDKSEYADFDESFKWNMTKKLHGLQCFCLPCPSASPFLETIKAVGTEVILGFSKVPASPEKHNCSDKFFSHWASSWTAWNWASYVLAENLCACNSL